MGASTIDKSIKRWRLGPARQDNSSNNNHKSHQSPQTNHRESNDRQKNHEKENHSSINDHSESNNNSSQHNHNPSRRGSARLSRRDWWARSKPGGKWIGKRERIRRQWYGNRLLWSERGLHASHRMRKIHKMCTWSPLYLRLQAGHRLSHRNKCLRLASKCRPRWVQIEPRFRLIIKFRFSRPHTV